MEHWEHILARIEILFCIIRNFHLLVELATRIANNLDELNLSTQNKYMDDIRVVYIEE
jgi:hypothetical protein